jgi:hypothetical protein
MPGYRPPHEDPAMRSRALLAAASALLLAAVAHADAFDHYINPVLAKVPDGHKELAGLASDAIFDNSEVLPGVKGALVVVYTNDNHWAKLLVTAAGQKFQADPKAPAEILPMLRIERYLTYREASDRAVKAEGRAVSLFPGFHFNLDLGQVVPAKFGDITVVETKSRQFAVKPVGKAKLYLITKPMPEATTPRGEKAQFGGKFEPRFFTGTYKLYDDGRRSGTLRLAVGGDNDVTGTLVSDDGREYEVRGAVAKPTHKILFTVKFPQTEQAFEGHMFTGDGKAIAGTSKLQDRDAGFYAVRVEE